MVIQTRERKRWSTHTLENIYYNVQLFIQFEYSKICTHTSHTHTLLQIYLPQDIYYSQDKHSWAQFLSPYHLKNRSQILRQWLQTKPYQNFVFIYDEHRWLLAHCHPNNNNNNNWTKRKLSIVQLPTLLIAVY